MRIALIKDGVVRNISAYAGDKDWWDAVSMQYTLVDVTELDVKIGDNYDGVSFTSPPEPTIDESQELVS